MTGLHRPNDSNWVHLQACPITNIWCDGRKFERGSSSLLFKVRPFHPKKIPKSHTPGLDVNLWESRNSSQLPSTQDNASWLPKSHPRVGRAPTVLVRYPEVNQVDNTHLQSKNDGEILPTALSLCSHQSTGTQYGSYRPFGESQLARGVHGVLGFSSTCG